MWTITCPDCHNSHFCLSISGARWIGGRTPLLLLCIGPDKIASLLRGETRFIKEDDDAAD